MGFFYTARFACWLSAAYLPVMRAVGDTVRSDELIRGLFLPVSPLCGLEAGHIGGRSLAEPHLLALHEEHLADGADTVDAEDAARRQHIAELGVVRIPIGLYP